MIFRKKDAVKAELQLKRALPVGGTEFHEWSDRIIQGAMLPATVESQKYTLANIIVNNCGPNIAFETDLYFIHFLRKHAANQIAVAVREEIYKAKQDRMEAEKQKTGEVTPSAGKDAEFLGIREVPSS